MTCPECARREAEIADQERRRRRTENIVVHVFAIFVMMVGAFEVGRGHWKDPTVAWAAMAATAYAGGCLYGVIAWLVRRRRAKRTNQALQREE